MADGSITKDGVWVRARKTPDEVGPWVQTWIDKALTNWFIRNTREPTWIGEPPISADDFVAYDTSEEMAAAIVRGNWNTGTAFFIKGSDSVWINTMMGGCEMMVIKQDRIFESISAALVAGCSYKTNYEPVDLDKLVGYIEGINRSTVEQCVSWNYFTARDGEGDVQGE